MARCAAWLLILWFQYIIPSVECKKIGTRFNFFFFFFFFLIKIFGPVVWNVLKCNHIINFYSMGIDFLDDVIHNIAWFFQDAKKGVLFIDFPPVLQLQLKRFEYDFMRDTMVKVSSQIIFLCVHSHIYEGYDLVIGWVWSLTCKSNICGCFLR